MQADTTVLELTAQDERKSPYIASMGIYLLKTEILLKLLRWHYPAANDFGSEIIPLAMKDYNVKPPKFYFYDPLKPIFTSPQFLPQTKMEQCRVVDSIVSDGCFLRECCVKHSIVGIRSRLEYGVEMKDTLMRGADNYQN